MTIRTTERPSGLVSSVIGAWNRFWQRRRAVAELQSLGDAELDRIVQDAGLTFSDLLALAKRDGESSSLLYRRLEHAALDFKAIEPAILRDMQRCCSLCDSKIQCAHELEDRPKVASWPKYCPNRQTIDALGSAKCH